MNKQNTECILNNATKFDSDESRLGSELASAYHHKNKNKIKNFVCSC